MALLADMDRHTGNRIYCGGFTDAGVVSFSFNVDMDPDFAGSIFTLNVSSTRLFAESEFWLSLVKVLTIICFIGLGLAAIFGVISYHGHESAPLFSKLTEHGWFPNGVFPIFATMLIVNFAFSGTELIGVAAGEAENPAQTVPKAINAAIWRLLIFFVGTIIVICALLPYEMAG